VRQAAQKMRQQFGGESHMQTLTIYELGFNQNYYTSALIFLINIVLCSKFPLTKFVNYKCFEMRFGWDPVLLESVRVDLLLLGQISRERVRLTPCHGQKMR
jgi:hypothetical protein